MFRGVTEKRIVLVWKVKRYPGPNPRVVRWLLSAPKRPGRLESCWRVSASSQGAVDAIDLRLEQGLRWVCCSGVLIVGASTITGTEIDSRQYG